MVSPLWNACSEGDIDQVQHLLKEASAIDIELKDDTGATALLQAVRNGHVDVVRALLDAGADLSNASSQGNLEQFTSDATILALLSSARQKPTQVDQPPAHYYGPEGYPQEYSVDPSKPYYGQPHGSYMFFPPVYPGAAYLPDGSPAPYYGPPQPSAPAHSPSESIGVNNYPPPEVSKTIPCKFFPLCRNGDSCPFAHPQVPFFQGPLPPPAQYPIPFDPMAQPPYGGGYYPVPQTPYPPNTAASHSVNPMSPPLVSHQSPIPHQNHARTTSEVMSPMQAPFSPSAMPAPVPYAMSMPAAYSQPGQMPPPPIPVSMPQLPPPQQPIMNGSQPNGVVYPPTSPVVQPHNSGPAHRRNSSIANPQNATVADSNAVSYPQPLSSHQEGNPNASRPPPRDGVNHIRRGSFRRSSLLGPSNRKPPCLFFPSGRCRNGEGCRFPHIMPDANDTAPSSHYFSKFGNRGRPHHTPAVDSLEEKMSTLALRTNGETEAPQPNGHSQGPPQFNHVNGNTRPHSNFKANHAINGIRNEKRNNLVRPSQLQQRVPNAEDFPVLAGATTPPARSPGVSPLNGPTAAQVLQAPPPARKDSTKSQPPQATQPAKGSETPVERASSPQSVQEAHLDEETHGNGHVNGINGINGVNGSTHDSASSKPVSFAAVASASPSAPELANTVSVSA